MKGKARYRHELSPSGSGAEVLNGGDNVARDRCEEAAQNSKEKPQNQANLPRSWDRWDL